MNKTVRVAINGAGRIGRAFYRLAREHLEIEVVAINDLGSVENIAYLMRHDSVYGRPSFVVETNGINLVVDGREIRHFSEVDPKNLPWKNLNIDVVVEATGAFTSYAKAKAHLDAGARRVVVTAPMKDGPEAGISGATVLMGVNEEKLSTCLITSNASCTTNAGSPLIAILDEALGIEKAVLNTTHGYTASQSLVDGPSKKNMREGRAAAQNIVPSRTGAAIAVTKAFTKLEGLFDGIAVRVPVVAGSLVDVTFISKRPTSREEVNEILKKAAEDKRWEDVFAVTEEELVSSDIIGDRHGSLADLNFTRVVGGNLVKVLAWYDNEMGYAQTLLNHVIKLGQYI
ncbi:MAG: glyceraldehyde 3-phosphate dehydrogenase NAD-binding domain-containing protein [Patescibacteria group bacterium]